ncbi:MULTISPECIES: hypothetical protein [Nostocales]|uniref:hypothetical protein n=1 Tax=Nostocales TaxID=1161 RepID=UPI00232C0728|nr:MULTISPECIES: hypothetical protein [Nostocales]MBO1048616.1 hypothetical protein [Dolichospermum sp. DEX182a]MDB9439479.1 hypothetical protein [Dolichospermum lemmermannii CS-548]
MTIELTLFQETFLFLYIHGECDRFLQYRINQRIFKVTAQEKLRVDPNLMKAG